MFELGENKFKSRKVFINQTYMFIDKEVKS